LADSEKENSLAEVTNSNLADRLERLAGEVHQIKVWLVGNGTPGIFGDLREIRSDLLRMSADNTAAAASAATAAALVANRVEARKGWQTRLLFEVVKSVAVVALITALGWAFAEFVIGVKFSVGR
jgi:hypothetical protein